MKYRIVLYGEDVTLTPAADKKMPLRANGFLKFDPKENVDLYLIVQDGKILIWNEAKRIFAPKKGE